MPDKKKELPNHYGYNHLEVGHPDNLKPYRVCGARTRSSDAVSTVCQRVAGWGTAHNNEGRCSYHGGNSLMGPDKPNWNGGRYAKVFKHRLAERLLPEQEDTNPLDLRSELEVSRITLALALDRMLAGANQPGVTDKQKKSGSLAYDQGVERQVQITEKGGGTGLTELRIPADIPDTQFFQFPESDSSPAYPAPVIVPAPDDGFHLVSVEDINLVRECTNDVINAATKMIVARNQTALTRAEITYILSLIKEAIVMFVPKENREAFVKYLMERVPVAKNVEEI